MRLTRSTPQPPVLLDADALRERGGPYTPAEFFAVHAPVDERPRPALPADIVAAAAEVDNAVDDYDAVQERWGRAMHARDRARSIADRADLGRLAAALAEERDRAGERLTKTRVEYHTLRRAHSEKEQVDRYRATVAAQLSEKRRVEEAESREREEILARFPDVRIKGGRG